MLREDYAEQCADEAIRLTKIKTYGSADVGNELEGDYGTWDDWRGVLAWWIRKAVDDTTRDISECDVMLNVDNPLFDGLVGGSIDTGALLNTIRHLKKQRDECRRLLRAVLASAEPWEGLNVYQVNLTRDWIQAAKASGESDIFSRCQVCNAIVGLEPGNDRVCDSCEDQHKSAGGDDATA